jgi:hypothetical protein
MTPTLPEPNAPEPKPPITRTRRLNTLQRIGIYYKKGFRDWLREFLQNWKLIGISLLLVVAATAVDYHAGVYVTSTGTMDVPDLILNRIEKPIDLSLVFVYGYIAIIVALFSYPLVFHIRTLHRVISQFSLLVALRSGFIILTHLETPAHAIDVSFPGVFGKLSFENDMFFSGHTAIPFLGFLLFRHSPIRYFFLLGSFVMGTTVLAMRQHYSIDVFGAFFITYCSYRMGNAAIQKLTPAVRDE